MTKDREIKSNRQFVRPANLRTRGYQYSIHGAGALWLIITMFCVVIVFLLAADNMEAIKSRIKEHDAWSAYAQMRKEVSSTGDESKKIPIVLIFNQWGPGSLPYPMENLQIPEGMVVDFMVRFWLLGFGDIRMLQVRHNLGRRAFRFISVNGKSWEQTISVEK